VSEEQIVGELQCCLCDKEATEENPMLLISFRRSYVALHAMCLEKSVEKFRDFHTDV